MDEIKCAEEDYNRKIFGAEINGEENKIVSEILYVN